MASHSQSIPKIEQSNIIDRSPVFYGWVIWFVAMIGMIATSPGQSFSVSLFIDHYITDFGVDRTTVSTLFSLGTFISSLCLTWVGIRIDRHGNRAVGIVVLVLFSLVLVSLSQINGLFTLFLSFFAIRFLGQGSLGLVSSTAIARWWRYRRGWVVSLALVGFSLFQGAYLGGLQAVIEAYGWRTSWIILGLVIAVILIPLWVLFMRDQPEKYGLLPDGDNKVKNKDNDLSQPETDVEVNWTLKQAQHSRAFWVFLFGAILSSSWGTGLIFHQVSLFDNVGHDAQVTAETFGIMSVVSALLMPLIGRYISRIRPNYVMIVYMLATAGALLLALVMTERWMLVLYAIFFGAMMAIGSTFSGTVWADLFGRKHHGAIRGFVATASVFGTSIGPVAFGFSYDYLGGYNPVIYAGVVIIAIEIVMCFFVKMPQLQPE